MFYNPENGTVTYPSTSFSLSSHGSNTKSTHDHGHHHGPYGSTSHGSHKSHETTTLATMLTTLLTTTTTTSTTTTTTTTPSPIILDGFSDETFLMTENFTIGSPQNETNLLGALIGITTEVHHRSKRGLRGPYSIYECRRSDIMGALVQNASPFLFPCTIEYSLVSRDRLTMQR